MFVANHHLHADIMPDDTPGRISLAIDLPPDLFTAWLTLSYASGRAMQDVLEDAIRSHVMTDPAAHAALSPLQQSALDSIVKENEARRNRG